MLWTENMRNESEKYIIIIYCIRMPAGTILLYAAASIHIIASICSAHFAIDKTRWMRLWEIKPFV